MRTKRAMISMAIFLSVFSLAGIVGLNTYSNELLYAARSEQCPVIDQNVEVLDAPPQPTTTEEVMTAISADSGEFVNSEDYDDTLSSKVPEQNNQIVSEEIPKEDVPVEENSVKIKAKQKTSVQEEPVQEKALYSNIGISIANSYVNLRKEANAESDILGKLYKDSAAEILDTDGDWCYVESGSIKGYVKSEYLKTGISDEKLIEQYGTRRISVDVDGLNVRKKPAVDAERLAVIYLRETYNVIDLHDEWVKVDISDENVIGYVLREHVNLIVTFNQAISKEEEQELLRLQAEARIANETAVKLRDEVDCTTDEIKLLACLIHAEAGNQSYEGKLAVANVVLNRVKSSQYPDSIKNVIYQSGQFSVSASGSLAKQLSNYSNYTSESQRLSIKAAKAALAGANNIGNRLYFHTYKAAVLKGYDERSSSVKIQDHLFW